MKYSRVESEILSDNRSGSSEILLSVLSYVQKYFESEGFNNSSIKHIQKFCGNVVNKFPAMAIVRSGLVKLDRLLANCREDLTTAEQTLHMIESLIKVVQGSDKKIIKNCRLLFKKKMAVATYSNSGLVKKVLHYYRSKIRTVYLSEARPAAEGKEMARFLSEAGISVCYMIDALLPEMMANADLLLLGTDSVTPEYFINKAGTTTLLKTAATYDIVTAVVFESLKASQPDKYKAIKLDYDPNELWPGKRPANITVMNQYFEPIPNKLVDQFISDYGIDNPDLLSRRIEGLI